MVLKRKLYTTNTPDVVAAQLAHRDWMNKQKEKYRTEEKDSKFKRKIKDQLYLALAQNAGHESWK